MTEKTNSKNDIRRLEIAGLYTLSYFGYLMHSVLHNLMAHGMTEAKLKEIAEMMKNPSMLTMFFIWNVLTILPPFLAFILKGIRGWWFITIFGAVVVLANGWHAVVHIMQGDVFNGGNTFVLQIIPAVWALVWSYTHTRQLKD